MRGWVKILLIMIFLPLLMGGVVLFIAGRPVAFSVLHQRIASKFPEVQWISTQGLAGWLESPRPPQPVLLDARTGPEFQLSHLSGARPIDPYRPSLRSVHGLAPDTPVVVYSSVGYRGARVARWLAGAGYRNVQNLVGGLFLWANEDRPLVKDEARPTAMVHPYDRKWGLLVRRRYRAEAPDLPPYSAAP